MNCYICKLPITGNGVTIENGTRIRHFDCSESIKMAANAGQCPDCGMSIIHGEHHICKCCYICKLTLAFNDKTAMDGNRFRHFNCESIKMAASICPDCKKPIVELSEHDNCFYPDKVVKCKFCNDIITDPIYHENCEQQYKPVLPKNPLKSYKICTICGKTINGNGTTSEITGLSRHTDCAANKNVDHPKHYGGADNVYETIKIIEALGHGESFCIGNALKYICRYKEKNGVEDLRKAAWYINRVIEQSDNIEHQ